MPTKGEAFAGLSVAIVTPFKQGQVDYQRMFTMIKTKLVRERGIIL